MENRVQLQKKLSALEEKEREYLSSIESMAKLVKIQNEEVKKAKEDLEQAIEDGRKLMKMVEEANKKIEEMKELIGVSFSIERRKN